MADDQPRPEGRARTLSGRLILFGTLTTLGAVISSYIVLNAVIRRQTRIHLVELLAQNQTNARDLQERSLQELLLVSTLMTQSPTLRAALDTYRSESAAGDSHRADLLATVGTEVRKIRELMGKGIVVVTDERGAVLAADSVLGARLEPGSTLYDRFWIREVLDSDDPEARPVFAVMTLGGDTLHVGCVPITLQGFVIGTLTLGDRTDTAWLAGLQEGLRSEVMLLVDGQVAGSTREAGQPIPALMERLSDASGAHAHPPELARVGQEEYLTLPIALGKDDQGRPATLLLMQSLTRALQPVQRSMFVALLSCGALTVTLAGVAAWRISRSILNPLERFVAFIRSVATSRDASRRFEDRGLASEIRYLNGAFSELLASVQEHQQQMRQHQREELIRVDRLKESEKLASLGRMLSGAAHEINNPLTAVLGQVELSLASSSLEDTLRSRLESARREGHRVAALVRTLLKVAHRDTGERARVDLHHLLRETLALRQHDYNAAGIGLSVVPCDDRVLLEANELELQQVFLNIINNALDAMKGIRGNPALVIRTHRDGSQVVVTLEDNGPGMKDPRKVFDHFYTTKEVGKGTGLGLSITIATVQNHGGSITAHNRPEGGACFTVTLPALAKERGRALEPALKPGAAAPLDTVQVASALIVEDEPTVLEYQMEMLRLLGASPVAARSGDEAIELLAHAEFEVIVTDLKMPGKTSGAALFDWVAVNRPALASRFIFVTGDSASDSTRQFLEQAGRPYLIKPFNMEDYIRALREAQISYNAA